MDINLADASRRLYPFQTSGVLWKNNRKVDIPIHDHIKKDCLC